MSDTSSSDEVARSSLAKTLENNIGPYLKTVKNLIVDTKLANDPSQDNFIKCLIGMVLTCLLTGNGSEMFISLVISVYPGYKSIKAVLSQEVEDDQRWLKYWILVSVFLTLQMPGDWVLGWAPGFSLAKIAFLLWCMAPIQENGSVILFQKVVLPYYEKYSSDIDRMMAEAASSAEVIIKSAVDKVEDTKTE